MVDKRAVLVGIDSYPGSDKLVGCAKDASDLCRVLERNENQTRNFHCDLLTNLYGDIVDPQRIARAVDELFSEPASCALFYFAGHGHVDPVTGKGYFITQSKTQGETGRYRFDDLLARANSAFSKNNIHSTVIIVDCCYAGAIGEEDLEDGSSLISRIGPGVTILAAAGRRQAADSSTVTGGLFTQYMVDGLRGSAANLRGEVTPASLYAHIDQILGPKGQRPVYKANVRRFMPLRTCTERVPLDTLIALPKLFKDAEKQIPLGPEYEPNRDNTPKWLEDIPPEPEKVKIFVMLQQLNRQGLVVPVGAEHMYYAAIDSKSCKLTELGKHYREMAVLGWL